MTWPPRRSWCAAVLVGALLLGACGESKYRYVTNSATSSYLKVPRSWASFDEGQLSRAEAQLLQQAGDQSPSAVDREIDRALQWRVAFDASAQPSISHVTGFGKAPVVDVRVRKLLASERDQVSMERLRNLVVPYDQLADEARKQEASKDLLERTNTQRFRPLGEREIQLKNGMRGVRVVFELRGDDGGFYTIDQTALVDGKTSQLYLLLIQASEQQYFANIKLLNEIAGSFTVKQKD